MTPIQIAALRFVDETRSRRDPVTGRMGSVDLRKISEPMRQRIIDLGMMDPPLVAVSGDEVFTTGAGYVALKQLQGKDSPR